jgi:membrane-bound serine protease (ClpP class)
VFLLTGIALAIFVVPEAWRLPVILGSVLLEIVETTITWRLSRRGATKVGPETLIGALGRAITDCRPTGTVRVHGEDWQAHCGVGVSAGGRVRVRGREGLTLLVEPVARSAD